MPSSPSTDEIGHKKDEVKGSLEEPISVPTHGSGGTFAVKATAHINAPPSVVLAAVRDTTTWPKWNTFCPKATISFSSSAEKSPMLEVGTVATILVYMTGKPEDASRDQGIVVTFVDEEFVGEEGKKGCRIAWKSSGYSHWQLRSERVMEFLDDGSGGTEYVCWETFGGVLGRVVKAMVGGQLVDRFKDYASDLKGFVEASSTGKN